MYVILIWQPEYKRHQYVLRRVSDEFLNITLVLKLCFQNKAQQDLMLDHQHKNAISRLEKSSTCIKDGPYQGIYASWDFAKWVIASSKDGPDKIRRLERLIELHETEIVEAPSLDSLRSSRGLRTSTETQRIQLPEEDGCEIKGSEISGNLDASSEKFGEPKAVHRLVRDCTSEQKQRDTIKAQHAILKQKQLDTIEVQHDFGVLPQTTSMTVPQTPGSGNRDTVSQPSIVVKLNRPLDRKAKSKRQQPADNAEVRRLPKKLKLTMRPESGHTASPASIRLSADDAESTNAPTMNSGDGPCSSPFGLQLSEAKSIQPSTSSIRTFLNAVTDHTEAIENEEARCGEIASEISASDTRILALEKELTALAENLEIERCGRKEKLERHNHGMLQCIEERRVLGVLLKQYNFTFHHPTNWGTRSNGLDKEYP